MLQLVELGLRCTKRKVRDRELLSTGRTGSPTDNPAISVPAYPPSSVAPPLFTLSSAIVACVRSSVVGGLALGCRFRVPTNAESQWGRATCRQGQRGQNEGKMGREEEEEMRAAAASFPLPPLARRCCSCAVTRSLTEAKSLDAHAPAVGREGGVAQSCPPCAHSAWLIRSPLSCVHCISVPSHPTRHTMSSDSDILAKVEGQTFRREHDTRSEARREGATQSFRLAAARWAVQVLTNVLHSCTYVPFL